MRALLIAGATLALLAGCASTPTQTTAAAAQAPVAAAATTTQAPAGKGVDLSKYRVVTRDGVQYYCQTTAPTGTKMRTREECYTKEQLATLEFETRRAIGAITDRVGPGSQPAAQ